MANLRAGWYLNVVNSFGESPVAGTEIAAWNLRRRPKPTSSWPTA